jgi:hypothetical protein
MFPSGYLTALRQVGVRPGGSLTRRLLLAANFGNHTYPATESASVAAAATPRDAETPAISEGRNAESPLHSPAPAQRFVGTS